MGGNGIFQRDNGFMKKFLWVWIWSNVIDCCNCFYGCGIYLLKVESDEKIWQTNVVI